MWLLPNFYIFRPFFQSPCNLYSTMKNIFYWVFLLTLIFIHTLDMYLTMYFIGNQWENETFLPMSLCIKHFGIYNAIWISRIIMYLFFYLSFYFRDNENFVFGLFIINIVYYTAMFNWLFTLGILPSITNEFPHSFCF